nr:MAG TPA: hypothetical protein [Caudoviricetes sp.]
MHFRKHSHRNVRFSPSVHRYLRSIGIGVLSQQDHKSLTPNYLSLINR